VTSGEPAKEENKPEQSTPEKTEKQPATVKGILDGLFGGKKK